MAFLGWKQSCAAAVILEVDCTVEQIVGRQFGPILVTWNREDLTARANIPRIAELRPEITSAERPEIAARRKIAFLAEKRIDVLIFIAYERIAALPVDPEELARRVLPLFAVGH